MDCFEIFKLLQEQNSFDVIFMDINLPLVNGKDCLKQIKADEKFKDVPVIMFTGSSAPMDIDFGYSNGAHYHVVKPIAHINFVASLRIVLEINWKEKQPIPPFENYVVNLTFNN
jgi:CheY-like chemotaxis protein